MEGSPDNIVSDDVKKLIKEINGIQDIHHIHVWHLDESRIALEAHIVVTVNELKEVELIKEQLKLILNKKFKITHPTLEFEHSINTSCDDNN